MQAFKSGQRWISSSELQMGLGTVLDSDLRSVTIVFLATGETRIYAKESAPLARVSFKPGDLIKSHEGWNLMVERVLDNQGLFTYYGIRDDGSQAQLEEGELDNHIQLNRPADRLFSGQIDVEKWFELRYQTIQHLNKLANSDLHGLIGTRTSLIPHQLYIAHEVSRRYAPRVLLADEVGLGKTIEAGLIIHQQLVTERVQRVLIIVPENLIHQWLVEMLRKFNLHFTIFDQDRFEALIQGSPDSNPFESEQLVLCSLKFATQAQHLSYLEQDNWDLLIVDEAHHLLWAPQHASAEYCCIERIANSTKGVLLLTATPEQLGKASHFARLRLLDSDRFPDLQQFIDEEESYEPIADLVNHLLSDKAITDETHRALLSLVESDNRMLLEQIHNHDYTDELSILAREQLIQQLLDRHGTSRVLFRNTRAAIKGFPSRQLHAYPLELPQAYKKLLKCVEYSTATTNTEILYPEILYRSQSDPTKSPWVEIDPRIPWLHSKIQELYPAKMLIICATLQTTLDIATALRQQYGIHSAMFHENMSLVERDRNANYFSDQEHGSQLLLCSEIGSEGRNFQFAHHLALFDLPLNPDLLEQRIGRLDRIGQTETIRIHTPYLTHSPQSILFRWYQEGLDAFENTCPAGPEVFSDLEQQLLFILQSKLQNDEDLDSLIETTKNLHQKLSQRLHEGRDKLLEFNSCIPSIANDIVERALSKEQDSTLFSYLSKVFDCFGVDFEEQSSDTFIVRPSDHMQTDSFPGLHSDGMTITFHRDIALANEDIHFISWEHPLASGALDLMASNEMGNTALIAIKHKEFKPGVMLLECCYLLQSADTRKLQCSRYLPPTSIRIVVDTQGRQHQARLQHDWINRNSIPVDLETAQKIVFSQSSQLKNMLSGSNKIAQQESDNALAPAYKKSTETLRSELDRLNALKPINPNIRMEEIEFFHGQLAALHESVASATPMLDAIRVIVTT